MGGFLRIVLSLGKGDEAIEFGVSLKRGEAKQLLKLLKGKPRDLMSRVMQGESLNHKDREALEDAIAEALLTLRARSPK